MLVRLHCKVGDRTDAGFQRQNLPATPSPRAVWKAACTAMGFERLCCHRASFKRCSEANFSHHPHQAQLLLTAHRLHAALRWASTAASGHPSSVRKLVRAQEVGHLAQKSQVINEQGLGMVPVPEQPSNRCSIRLMKCMVRSSCPQTQPNLARQQNHSPVPTGKRRR